MSGTQYHIDQSLFRELNDESQEIATLLSQSASLKQLIEFKYIQQDEFGNRRFSKLPTKEQLLIVNALLVYRLSCIDHVYYFSSSKIDFILNEYLHAYEDFLHIKERNFIDFEETLRNSYPSAIKWMNLIEQQSQLNEQLQKSGKDWLV